MAKHKRTHPAAAKNAAETRCDSPHEDAFHGLAGRIVRAIEPHTEASRGALLIQFLAAFGFSVGRCAHYFADGARHYPNLFVVLVGDTSKARKGTSWNRVRDVFELLPCWPRDRVTTGLSSGEGLIEQVKDTQSDTRLLVIQTEFGSVLQVMTRIGNTLSPVLRDAWDGTDLRVMAKQRPASACGEHIAIIAHTTADELTARLETNDLWNGFANRFLWCAVSRANLLPLGGQVDNATITPLAKELCNAITWAQTLNDARVMWDRAAEQEWRRVYASLAGGLHGLIGAVTSRAEAQVVRLSLIYALLDKSKRIRTAHLRAALAIWAFCESSARRVFASSTGDRTADRIREALRQSDRGLSRTDISKLFDGHKSSDDIARALKLLVELELAECRLEKGAGRATQRWFAKK